MCMHTQRFQGDHNSLQKELLALDLEPIKFKLMDSEEGEGWSLEVVEELEKKYRNFLFLSVTSTDPIVPTKNVDKFWHYHILDTIKYAEDCQNLFGFFLHHFPYIGMRGDQDKADLGEAFARTKSQYELAFSQQFSRADASVEPAGCGPANCGCTDCLSVVPDIVLDGPKILDFITRPRPSLSAV